MKRKLLALTLSAFVTIGMAQGSSFIQDVSATSGEGNGRYLPTAARIGESMEKCVSGMSDGNKKTPSRIITTDLTPITEIPAGRQVMYSRLSYGSYIFNGIQLAFGPQDGTAATVIYGDDGYAYIWKPFSGWPTFSFLKCEIDGNRLTATLPQPMFYEPDMYNPTVTHTYFATYLQRIDDGSGIVMYGVADTENLEQRTVSWIIDGDRLFLDMGYDPTPDADGNQTYPDEFFGLADENGVWAIAGDCYQEYTPVSYEALKVPEGLDTEQWTIVSKEGGKAITVAFDGEDVYLTNLSDYTPDSWVKGKIKEGKVIFDSRQYLGEGETFYNFFMTATYAPMDDKYTLTDCIVFNYDKEKKIMTSAVDESMMVNSGKNRVYYLSMYQDPLLKVRNMNPNPVPSAPMPTNFADYYDYYGFSYFEFDIPNLNVENDLLDTSNLYYQIYFDDELYTFSPEDHYVTEDISNIPYLMNNQVDIFADGASHAVYFYFTGFDTIGLKTLNIVDGTTYESPMTVYDVLTGNINSGIHETVEKGEPVSVEFHNLQGIRVENPENGIYLKTEIYKDGSRRTVKTVVR